MSALPGSWLGCEVLCACRRWGSVGTSPTVACEPLRRIIGVAARGRSLTQRRVLAWGGGFGLLQKPCRVLSRPKFCVHIDDRRPALALGYET